MKKILFILCLFTPLWCFADWPMFMGNHYLTGNNDEIVPDKNSLNWQFKAPSSLYYPVPQKDLVFVNSLDRNLYALNKVTGEVAWKCNLNYPALRSCVAYRDYVLLTAGDYIFSLDSRNGSILWSRKEGVSIQLSTPIVENGIVYYGSRKFFYARHIQNGALIWENKDVDIYGGTPIFWNKRIYFISKDYSRKTSRLLCLSSTNGSLLWQSTLPLDPNVFTPVVYDSKVFIGSVNKLFAMDGLTGTSVWEKKFENPIASSTVFANSLLMLSLSDGKIYLLDPIAGSVTDSFPSFNKAGAQFILVGETLYIPNQKGELYAYHYPTRTVRWKFQSQFTNQGGTLSAEDGRIYFATGNLLYSLSPGRLPPASSYIAGTAHTGPVSQSAGTNTIATVPGPGEIVNPPPTAEKEKVLVNLRNEKNTPVEGEVIVDQNNSSVKYPARNGQAQVEVEKEKGFTVTAEARDYFVKTETIPPAEKRKSIDMTLDPLVRERSYVFHNIEFAYNSAELDPSSLPTLEAIGKMLLENPKLEIEVRGYTDNIGGKEFNLKLSERRAEKVREFLVKGGVLDTRLRVKGFGLGSPVASNDTEEGRAKNRRTEFFILKK